MFVYSYYSVTCNTMCDVSDFGSLVDKHNTIVLYSSSTRVVSVSMATLYPLYTSNPLYPLIYNLSSYSYRDSYISDIYTCNPTLFAYDGVRQEYTYVRCSNCKHII